MGDIRKRRQALFMTPVMPAETGSGLAMRAGMTLQALTSEFDVSLLVLPVLGTIHNKAPRALAGTGLRRVVIHDLEEDPEFLRLCSSPDTVARTAAWALYPRPLLGRFATESNVLSAQQVFGTVSFDLVHVFRLYLAPFALPYLHRPGGLTSVDCDDYQSETMRQLAGMYREAQDEANAAVARAEALKYSHWEAKYLPLFDRVCVTCARDGSALADACPGARIAVVPNVVRLVDDPPAAPAGGEFTFLFLGNMSYLPNEDAAVYLCEQVLPLLRSMTVRPFRVLIAGFAPSSRVQRLGSHHGVEVLGAVNHVRDVYRRADAVVVPLRPAGGTKTKVLEAFAHRRPVVATPAGIEGLEVETENQVLVGGDPGTFAAQCRRLMGDRQLGERIAALGYEWVRSHHSPEVFRDALLGLIRR